MKFFTKWIHLERLFAGATIIAMNRGTKNIVLGDGTVIDFGFKDLETEDLTVKILDEDYYGAVIGQKIAYAEMYVYPGYGRNVNKRGCTVYIAILRSQGSWLDLLSMNVVGDPRKFTADYIASFIGVSTGEEILNEAKATLELEGLQWTLAD